MVSLGVSAIVKLAWAAIKRLKELCCCERYSLDQLNACAFAQHMGHQSNVMGLTLGLRLGGLKIC
eukprot:scaffold117134_cov18-Prasinocladus_malaysianus.AAC.1